ncbi:unnamed protein product [Phytophthora fragariaefolia]|uniref:Unnamed protein product n=1 Tax=Phytophthora fragariaefolia TaxID=1490495 RepID=A0A9W6XW72_9STRA|nr:unnamed protein product [Phytophthora fragariaefolia]
MELRAHAAQKHRKHSSASEGSESLDVSDDSWSEESNCRTSRSDASIQFETLSTVSDTGSSVTPADGSGGSSSHASSHQASLVRAVTPALEQTQFDSWESFHEYLVKYMAQSYQINACVRLIPGGVEDPVFAVFVTGTTLEHNHALGRVKYAQYASVRTSLTPQVAEEVNELRKAGAKKKSIHDYILEHTDRKMLIRDVHNLVRKLKDRDHSVPNSAKRLKSWMIEFCEDPGNVGPFFVELQEQNVECN